MTVANLCREAVYLINIQLKERIFYIRMSVQLEIKYFKFSYFRGVS